MPDPVPNPIPGPAIPRLTDALDPARAAALHATLGLIGAPPGAGAALPAFWHQIYFWDPVPAAGLGPDGHPAVGRAGPIPDLGLPQRMWAAGRLDLHRPLRLGQSAEKTTALLGAVRKQGRTGPLGFVTLEHRLHQDGQLCVTERQDLVYRGDAPDRRAVPPPEARRDESQSRAIRFDAVTLFRYSALTFNGHRIHYDLDFCRTEGHAGLVVHGPLLAQCLIGLAEAQLGPLASFSFRATAPLLHGETAELCLAGRSLWVRGPDGRQCMSAEAVPA